MNERRRRRFCQIFIQMIHQMCDVPAVRPVKTGRCHLKLRSESAFSEKWDPAFVPGVDLLCVADVIIFRESKTRRFVCARCVHVHICEFSRENRPVAMNAFTSSAVSVFQQQKCIPVRICTDSEQLRYADASCPGNISQPPGFRLKAGQRIRAV